MRREQRPLESKTEQWDPISGAQNLSLEPLSVLSVQPWYSCAYPGRETERNTDARVNLSVDTDPIRREKKAYFFALDPQDH